MMQARVYGAEKPDVRQVPKSSPVPLAMLARVRGAVVLIYNVHFIYEGVFGCRKFLRVYSLFARFRHLRGEPRSEYD